MTLDEAILKLIEGEEIADQSNLLRRLASLGHRVTQPTLSRHLRKLEIEKVAGRYRRADATSAGLPAFEVLEVAPCLLVIRTRPGYAQPLALMLDRSDVEGLAGTLAGDDTIFLAIEPAHQTRLAQLAARVRELLASAGARQ